MKCQGKVGSVLFQKYKESAIYIFLKLSSAAVVRDSRE